jgi:hypothetical protein
VAAAVRTEVLAAAKGLEVAERRVALDHDRPAVAAVTTVRPAARHVGLVAEARAAVTAGAGGDKDSGLVVEHSHIVVDGLSRGRGGGGIGGVDAQLEHAIDAA